MGLGRLMAGKSFKNSEGEPIEDAISMSVVVNLGYGCPRWYAKISYRVCKIEKRSII